MKTLLARAYGFHTGCLMKSAKRVLYKTEVAVGLAFLNMIYRNTGSVDINFLNRLKW